MHCTDRNGQQVVQVARSAIASRGTGFRPAILLVTLYFLRDLKDLPWKWWPSVMATQRVSVRSVQLDYRHTAISAFQPHRLARLGVIRNVNPLRYPVPADCVDSRQHRREIGTGET